MLKLRLIVLSMSSLIASSASAQDADELSKQLANPIASLISVPFQSNFDIGAGPEDDGFAYTLNIQPVIPVSLNDEWNMISRTILPISYRDYTPDGDVSGLGDTTQSLFFSPKAPTAGGLIWGIGPVLLVPTATDEFLGTGKWGAGPTGVALVQRGDWTVGALANHLWSFAGESDRPEVNSTYVQPFVSYSLGHGRSVSLNTETTYDWVNEAWTVPINLGFSQVMKIGEQPISFQIGGKYYAEAPEGGPEWGIRSTVTLLFPKK